MASAATSPRATRKTVPYMPTVTPTSRTRPARPPKTAASSSGRPYSLVTMAPATLKRSVIIELISASSSICSRVSPDIFRPTHLAGKMKIGSSTRATAVICQDSAIIAPSTSTSMTTLETTEDSVLVKARWAPITSVFSRETRAPVWVRMKNATGMRCTWSKTSVRRL
nr:hypothetical protein GCM10020093_028190 [Planobispora longispora]